MDAVTRKSIEKQVFNREVNQELPDYYSYWDRDLFDRMHALEYNKDIERFSETYLTNKIVLILGASVSDVDEVIKWTDKISAMNIAEGEIELIHKKYPQINAFVADAEMLNTGEKYEVIYCHSILHHLFPLDNVIDTLSNHLNQNGILFVPCEPGIFNPFAYVARKFFSSREHTPGEVPLNFFAFERLVKRNFNVVESSYYFLYSMLIPWLALKIPIFKGAFKPLLEISIQLEKLLRTLGILNNLYWVTAGVYSKK